MFTGIIENLGKFEENKDSNFVFSSNLKFCKKLKKGTSVSVNGVCLTVIKKPTNNKFSVEIMPETQSKTMLGKLKNKTIVNLELPATLNTFLSGHIVQGHIDGIGQVDSIIPDGNSKILTIKTDKNILDYIVKKGSVAINGISFTVVEADKNIFKVGVIPFTWKNTTLYGVVVGDFINIETDVLGKYLKNYINK